MDIVRRARARTLERNRKTGPRVARVARNARNARNARFARVTCCA